MTMIDAQTVAKPFLLNEERPITLKTLAWQARWSLLGTTMLAFLVVALPLWIVGIPATSLDWKVDLGVLLAVSLYMIYWYRRALSDAAETVWLEFVKKQTPPLLVPIARRDPLDVLTEASNEAFEAMGDGVTKRTLVSFERVLREIHAKWESQLSKEEALFERLNLNSQVPFAWRKLRCTAQERTRMQRQFRDRANRAGEELFQLRKEMGAHQVYQDMMLGEMAAATR